MSLQKYKLQVEQILNNQSYRTIQMNNIVSLYIKYKNHPCERIEQTLQQAITGYWYKQQTTKETRWKA